MLLMELAAPRDLERLQKKMEINCDDVTTASADDSIVSQKHRPTAPQSSEKMIRQANERSGVTVNYRRGRV